MTESMDCGKRQHLVPRLCLGTQRIAGSACLGVVRSTAVGRGASKAVPFLGRSLGTSVFEMAIGEKCQIFRF